MSGWIKLHRNLKEWEYYDDHNATRLLIHLLVSVNYEDKKWKDTIIKAGTMVSSWQNLAHETGLSLKQIRLAMSKLERVGEAVRQVAGKGAGKWQIISLVKWDKLQGFDDSEGQIKGQEKGRTTAQKRATTKEYKNKEIKKEEIINSTTIVEELIIPRKNFIIPSIQEISAYCLERNNQINPEQFYDHYQSNGWMVGKNKMKDWKASIRTWEKNNYSNTTQSNNHQIKKDYEPNAHVLKIVNRLVKDGDITPKQAEIARITIANSPVAINVQQLIDGIDRLKAIGEDFDLVNFRDSLRLE